MQNLLSITLRAVKLGDNVDREYHIALGQDLFKKWSVTIIYGRSGSEGTFHASSFDTQEQAWICITDKLKRRANASQRIGCSYQLTQMQSSPELSALLESADVQSLKQAS